MDIYNGDMRDQKFHCYQDAASLVILHPPYFNSYKYSSINSLESGWLGIDRSSFRSGEIKEFFKVGKPEKYADYVEDILPRYRRQDTQQTTLNSNEGKDTPAAQDAPEGAEEGE